MFPDIYDGQPTSAREIFANRLPPRTPLLALAPEVTGIEQLPFITNPVGLFYLLGVVSPDDATRLFASVQEPFLYKIAAAPLIQVRDISTTAVDALGCENVSDMALRLVKIPNSGKNKTGLEIHDRLVTGLRLSSSLPISYLRFILPEFANIARVDKPYQNRLLNYYASFLIEMADVFCHALYDLKKIDDSDLFFALSVLELDFPPFADALGEEYIRNSSNVPTLNHLGIIFTMLRDQLGITASEKQFEAIVAKMDDFLRSLGIQYRSGEYIHE